MANSLPFTPKEKKAWKERIRRFRTKRGWSQRRMAKEMRVALRTVRNLENSEYNLSPGTIVAYRNMELRVKRGEMMATGTPGVVTR